MKEIGELRRCDDDTHGHGKQDKEQDRKPGSKKQARERSEDEPEYYLP
jgi:hypothetical protein